MGARNDGGPAFPVLQEGWTRTDASGLSMRDYFAAMALQGILAGDHPITHQLDPLPAVARVAYEAADAMLKARAA